MAQFLLDMYRTVLRLGLRLALDSCTTVPGWMTGSHLSAWSLKPVAMISPPSASSSVKPVAEDRCQPRFSVAIPFRMQQRSACGSSLYALPLHFGHSCAAALQHALSA